MSLVQTIDEQLATAIREKTVARLAVMRLLKTSLKNEQIQLGHELSDDEALKVLARQAKQRKDSIELYATNGREELANAERAELAMIEEFLPKQMDEAALSAMIDAIIIDVNATSMTDMGVVIGAAMKQAAGAADGALVSRLVREKLSK